MGNIITGCIKLQVRTLGIGSLDQNFVKRCSACAARQYTSASTCRFCNGPLEVVSGGGRNAQYQPAHAIPVVLAADPSTGELVRYVVDGCGNLVRVGGGASGRLASDHPMPLRSTHSGQHRMGRVGDSLNEEEEEEDGNDEPLPRVDDINMGAVVSSASRLADLVDPERHIVDASIVPRSTVVESLQKTGKGSDQQQRQHLTSGIDQATHDAKESISCPVCLSDYRQPVTLMCGHSLCGCHLSDVGGRCPICRENVPRRMIRKAKEGDGTAVTNEILGRYVGAIQTLASVAERDAQAGYACSTVESTPAASAEGMRRRKNKILQ